MKSLRKARCRFRKRARADESSALKTQSRYIFLKKNGIEMREKKSSRTDIIIIIIIRVRRKSVVLVCFVRLNNVILIIMVKRPDPNENIRRTCVYTLEAN